MATRTNKTILKTRADIDKAWKQIEQEIAKHQKEGEGRHEVFAAITRAEFEAKLTRVNSPFIVWQAWSPSVPAGATTLYRLLLANYDVLASSNLALTVFFGNRNAIASNDEYLSGFDARFPTYAQRAPDGFTLGTAQYGYFNFQLTIPKDVEKTGYFGNCTLQKISQFGPGTLIERACFFFDVT